MKIVTRFVVFAAAALAVGIAQPAVHTAPLQPGQNLAEKYELVIRFDGGFAFLRDDAKKTLTVASFMVPGEVMGSAHKMGLKVLAGTATLNGGALTNGSAVALSGKDALSIPALLGGVVIPPPRPVSGCDDVKGTALDNTAFIPDITTIGGGQPTKSAIHTDYLMDQITLSGGTLHVKDVGSCYEIRRNGTPVNRLMQFAGGVGKVEVVGETTIPVTLTVGGKKLVAQPAMVNGKRQLVLHFGRFPACPPGQNCRLKVGDELKDFGRFYQLLQNAPEASQRLMPFLKKLGTLESPGEECPPLFFRIG